ncbi:MAG: hypothetical protein R2798_03875 [Chitinophagales bacterium]|nr:hypothetical protein [Bacteroidota bacterium]MCB9043121.1 hypothetical protein [Chitinophagales bacterium]
MKIRLLLISTIIGLCLWSFGALAQIDSGSKIIGGSLRYSNVSYRHSDENITTVELNPRLGYFFSDNMAVGAEVVYLWEKTNTFDQVSTALGIGPFGRYYLDAGVFGQVDVRYFHRNNGEIKSDGTSLGFGLGYAAFVTDNIAIEPIFGVRFGNGDLYKYKQQVEFYFNFGIQLYADRL